MPLHAGAWASCRLTQVHPDTETQKENPMEFVLAVHRPPEPPSRAWRERPDPSDDFGFPTHAGRVGRGRHDDAGDGD